MALPRSDFFKWMNEWKLYFWLRDLSFQCCIISLTNSWYALWYLYHVLTTRVGSSFSRYCLEQIRLSCLPTAKINTSGVASQLAGPVAMTTCGRLYSRVWERQQNALTYPHINSFYFHLIPKIFGVCVLEIFLGKFDPDDMVNSPSPDCQSTVFVET